MSRYILTEKHLQLQVVLVMWPYTLQTPRISETDWQSLKVDVPKWECVPFMWVDIGILWKFQLMYTYVILTWSYYQWIIPRVQMVPEWRSRLKLVRYSFLTSHQKHFPQHIRLMRPVWDLYLGLTTLRSYSPRPTTDNWLYLMYGWEEVGVEQSPLW